MKYILFELDHGGINNIIISFKFIILLAFLSNRTIVIPKSKSIYHFDWGPNGIVEDLNKLGNLPKTSLNDFLNLNIFSNLVNIITFEEFFSENFKNLKLPNNFLNYNENILEHNTMLIQGKRLFHKEPTNRGIYWYKRHLFLKKQIKSNKINNINLDLSKYCRKKFKIIKNFNIPKFIESDDQVIFIPMDEYVYTQYQKYPRIFTISSQFEPTNELQKKIWNQIIKKKYYHQRFYSIVEDIIKTKFLNNPYDALHWRFKGFNEKKLLSSEKILEKVSKYSKSKILFIASDSLGIFENVIQNKNENKYNFEIKTLKDFPFDKKYISFIEQILCINSNIFIGTHNSTFSNEIINNRTHKFHFYRNNKYIDEFNYLI